MQLELRELPARGVREQQPEPARGLQASGLELEQRQARREQAQELRELERAPRELELTQFRFVAAADGTETIQSVDQPAKFVTVSGSTVCLTNERGESLGESRTIGPPSPTGMPNSGVPSECQYSFCTRACRLGS